jgi:hypothetical protein
MTRQTIGSSEQTARHSESTDRRRITIACIQTSKARAAERLQCIGCAGGLSPLRLALQGSKHGKPQNPPQIIGATHRAKAEDQLLTIDYLRIISSCVTWEGREPG